MRDFYFFENLYRHSIYLFFFHNKDKKFLWLAVPFVSINSPFCESPFFPFAPRKTC